MNVHHELLKSTRSMKKLEGPACDCRHPSEPSSHLGQDAGRGRPVSNLTETPRPRGALQNRIFIEVKLAIILWLWLLYAPTANSQTTYQPNWDSVDRRETPQWFQDAKFGIFIHWGLFSVPAWGPVKDAAVYDKYAEWYWWKLLDPESPVNAMFRKFHRDTYGDKTKYEDFVNGFKCEMFEPDDWADILKGSGARYVVLTSKHHEGFCLWPSKQSWNWNAVDIGPHRDLAGDLIQAVRNKGLRMGYYYSLYEWFNPLYRSDVNRYVDEHMIPQMKDLVTRFKPDLLWTDGEWDYPSETWKSAEFLAWLYNESAVKDEIAVNDRWGKETRSKHGGYYTTEYGLVHGQDVKEGLQHPWEECRGIGGSFGYNRNENLDSYATSEQLVHLLIEKVAKGGNLLLNIGPTADGRIPVIMQQRLRDMGDWLKLNGEAIYGTRSWSGATQSKSDKIYFTRKGNDLYLICTMFPTASITVSQVNPPGNVQLLGFAGKVQYKAGKNSIVIEPPVVSPATNPCQYAWVFKLTGAL